MDFTDEDTASLGERLAGLDLTDGERAALVAVIDAVTGDDDEVSGFILENGAGKLHDSGMKDLFNPLGTGWKTGGGATLRPQVTGSAETNDI